ncbi:hypothetical protein [Blastococcus goldschmidtiae]|uniref:MYXO-CTERM domain-containing protein n=1 Tax=Blastococcus goldschmidtiae TaxID=3075546 RepID=A0ABU2KDS4_9ACTN|nr:hypothetical protein [Blastococcus sp. DSM 46792]MDT0278312.1 hypothetical protein [Blastococcus sp. DSM 46792]
MRPYLTAVAVVALFVLEVLGVLLGGADDSPGLQGIGGLLVLGAIALVVRAVRRGRPHPSHAR